MAKFLLSSQNMTNRNDIWRWIFLTAPRIKNVTPSQKTNKQTKTLQQNQWTTLRKHRVCYLWTLECHICPWPQAQFLAKHGVADQPGSSVHPWHTAPWRWKPGAGLPKFFLVRAGNWAYSQVQWWGCKRCWRSDQVWRRSSGPEDRCHLSPAWVELHRVGAVKAGAKPWGGWEQSHGRMRRAWEERGLETGGVLGMFCLFCFLSFAKFLCLVGLWALATTPFDAHLKDGCKTRAWPVTASWSSGWERNEKKQSSESQSNTQHVWPQGPSLASFKFLLCPS